MIVVDDEVGRRLQDTLRDFLQHPSEMAEIRLHFPQDKVSPERLRAEILPLVQQHIQDPDARLFFCEDGSMVIIAANVYTREAHKLALLIIKALDLPMLECRIEYNALRDYAGKHLLELEKRHSEEKRRKQAIEAERQAQVAQAQAALKRDFILNGAVNARFRANLPERRRQRKAPEIMMIEDDAFSRRLVGNILAKDYKLTSLADAETALATYASLAPDILFLDINLPMVTGHELLEKILHIDPDAYVIMLSGNADQKNVTEAMKRGAKGFVAKPFTPDKLYQYIRRCPTIQ